MAYINALWSRQNRLQCTANQIGSKVKRPCRQFTYINWDCGNNNVGMTRNKLINKVKLLDELIGGALFDSHFSHFSFRSFKLCVYWWMFCVCACAVRVHIFVWLFFSLLRHCLLLLYTMLLLQYTMLRSNIEHVPTFFFAFSSLPFFAVDRFHKVFFIFIVYFVFTI